MGEARLDTAPCTKCGKAFALRMVTCPFCAHNRSEPAVRDSAPQAASILGQASGTVPVKQPVVDRAAREEAVAAAIAEAQRKHEARVAAAARVCPICSVAAPGRVPLAIETWENLGTRYTFFHKRITTYNVQRALTPGVCGSCSTTLTKKRLLASALAVAPIYLLFVVGLVAAGLNLASMSMLIGIGMLFYAASFFGTLGYSWADRWVYGDALEDDVALLIPGGEHRSPNSEVRFPSGFAFAAMRLGLLGLGPALLVGVAIVALAAKSASPAKVAATSSATPSATSSAVPSATQAAPVPPRATAQPPAASGASESRTPRRRR